MPFVVKASKGQNRYFLTIASVWSENMLECKSAVICPEKGTVFWERSSDNVRRQIPVHIFVPNEATGAALSSKYVSRGGEFKIGDYHSDIAQSAQF